MNIAIVNDMPMAVEVLRRAVAVEPSHRVVWIAKNGLEAVQKCAETTPDLVLMDLVMPEMNGVEATRRIMTESPCAILLVTASIGANISQVFQAMGHGALDAVDTPTLGGGDLARAAAPLLKKIATIGSLIGLRSGTQGAPHIQHPVVKRHPLIAIGASAGGPAALAALLRGLPKGFPAAIVLIQHVDEKFAPGMAAWLGEQSPLPVRLAVEGETPVPGTVLLAATGDHLALQAPGRLGYVPDPADYAYRPSVDVFFQSVSHHWPGDAIGVLLTGMGRDGARGLKEMREKGHHTIAQDQATSAVYGMPKAAAALGAAVEILPLGAIAPRLLELTDNRGRLETR